MRWTSAKTVTRKKSRNFNLVMKILIVEIGSVKNRIKNDLLEASSTNQKKSDSGVLFF